MISSADVILEHLEHLAQKLADECRNKPHWALCRRLKACALADGDGEIPRCETVTARMWLEALYQEEEAEHGRA